MEFRRVLFRSRRRDVVEGATARSRHRPAELAVACAGVRLDHGAGGRSAARAPRHTPVDARRRCRQAGRSARGAARGGAAARLHDHGFRSRIGARSEEHTSELQSLMRISYAVFCLKKKKPLTTGNEKTSKT